MESKIKLIEVCTIIMGQSPPGDSYNKFHDGVPLLNGPTEFGSFHPTPETWTKKPTKKTNVGDLLFCVRGTTTGRMNWANEEYCIGRGICAIRGKTPSDTKFIYYSITQHLDRLLTNARGTVFLNLTKTDIENFEIPWFEDSTRNRIVAVLDKLDEEIKTLYEMNLTLEKIIRSIFKSWFIDFDGQTEFVESDNGKIPKGWKQEKLGDHAYIKGRIGWRGLSISEYVREGPYIITGPQILKDGSIDWESCSRVTNERYEESPEIMLKQDDILMTKDGTIGKLAFIDELIKPSTVASGIFVIRSNSPSINQMYLWNYFKSDIFRWLVESRIEGSVIPHLYQRDIINLDLVIPPKEKAKLFASVVSPLLRKIGINNQEKQRLNKIRTILLPKLMSGKIRV